MPPDTAKKDFFISYSKADLARAQWIEAQLKAAGYSVVIQAEDFGPGCNFILEMHQAAVDCERTLAVLSDHYLQALYTQPEWAAALLRDPTGSRRTLIPIRVQACQPQGLLAAIVYIDLVDLDDLQARQLLLKGLEKAVSPGPAGQPVIGIQKTSLQPAIWNVPHTRNPNFTGREDLHTALHDALHQEGASILTQTIHGLGGVGKTQTALEYSYRWAFEYDLVWWLGAEEPTKLGADYAALAAKLNLKEKALADQPAIIAAVKDWLRLHQNWLLIFDNAQEPGEIKPYLPGGNGHVLVTSRNPNWGALAGTQPVPVLPREQAVAFLLKRTGQEEANAADKLAHELGDLPLALEQAGAYIAASGITLQEYLELFQTRRRELWGVEANPENYEHTVAATWSLNLEQAEQEAPGAAALLNLCAFLAPDAIPRSLFEKEQDFLPPELNRLASDPLPRNRVFTALLRYSLLEVNTEDRTISMHRLVQAVIRDRLKEADRQWWTMAAVKLIRADYPHSSEDVRTWGDCFRLLPHAQAVTSYAEALQVGLNAAAQLCNQAGLFLRGRADYTAAKSLCERSVELYENQLGSKHPHVATAVNNLGLIHQDLGDLLAAKASFERALAIGEATLGPDHPNVATWVNNLGIVLRDLGDHIAAKAAFERALAIWEKQLGPNHPQVATGVNNLGSVLKDLGDLPAAQASFERALAIDKAFYGPDHPNIATRVNNIGSILKASGDLSSAKVTFERALAIDEAFYGLDHPNVATRINNLGSVLRDMGDLPAAKAAFERALAIREKFLGPDHPKTQLVRHNLAALNG